jgi:hypothetical protein
MSKRIFLFLLLSFVVFDGAAIAQTTAFSYQGRLTEAGSPANGTRFFRFRCLTKTARRFRARRSSRL